MNRESGYTDLHRHKKFTFCRVFRKRSTPPTKQRGAMRNAYGILAVIGLALIPWAAAAHAQTNPPAAPAAQPAETAPALIPPDRQPTKEQMAKLFEVMQVHQQVQAFEKMMPSVIQRQLHAQMEQTLAQLDVQPTPGQQTQLEALLNKYMQKSFDIYPYDEMISDLTVVYQRHISGSDVDAITTFYSSPAGQHLLTQQPVIMKEFMPIAMQHEQKGAAQLTDEMTQELDTLMKSMAPPANAPASK